MPLNSSGSIDAYEYVSTEKGRAVFGRVKTFANKPLVKAFTKASIGAGALFAIKATAVGVATSAGSGVTLAALTGGSVTTIYGAVRDFRKERQADPDNVSQGILGNLKSFVSFLWDHKAKYTGKLIKNSGFALIGAGFVEVFNDLAIGEAQAQEFSELAPPEILSAAGVLPSVDAVAEIAPEPEGPESVDMEPVHSPLDHLSRYDAAAFEGRSAEILSYALNGEPWAVKEMAASLLYEGNGSPIDKKLAVDLYNMAAESGVTQVAEQARADLAYIDQRWGLDSIMGTSYTGFDEVSVADTDIATTNIATTEPVNADVSDQPVVDVEHTVAGNGIVPDELSVEASPAPMEQLAGMDGLSERAEALRQAALGGDRQALGDIGIGMLNGWYGFDVDHEQGLALIREAAERGSQWHGLQLAMLEYGAGEPMGMATDQGHAVSMLQTLSESDQKHVATQAEYFLKTIGVQTDAPVGILADKTLLTLQAGDYAACDIYEKADGVNMRCLIDTAQINTGDQIQLAWPDGAQNAGVDLYYIDGNNGLVPEVAQETGHTGEYKFASFDGHTSAVEPVDCLTQTEGSVIDLSCHFTDQVRNFDAPVVINIPGSPSHLGLQFNFTPPTLYSQNVSVAFPEL